MYLFGSIPSKAGQRQILPSFSILSELHTVLRDTLIAISYFLFGDVSEFLPPPESHRQPSLWDLALEALCIWGILPTVLKLFMLRGILALIFLFLQTDWNIWERKKDNVG